jgi:hypothetical protein
MNSAITAPIKSVARVSGVVKEIFVSRVESIENMAFPTRAFMEIISFLDRQSFESGFSMDRNNNPLRVP